MGGDRHGRTPRARLAGGSGPLPDDPDKAPRFIAFRRAFSGLLQLDLGESTESNQPVWKEIKSRLPLSIWFGGWSLLLAYAVSIPLG